jgi:hypothetical protein
MNIYTMIFTIVSLISYYLISKKDIRGVYGWFISNTGFLILSFINNDGQIFLWIAYNILNFKTLYEWKKDENKLIINKGKHNNMSENFKNSIEPNKKIINKYFYNDMMSLIDKLDKVYMGNTALDIYEKYNEEKIIILVNDALEKINDIKNQQNKIINRKYDNISITIEFIILIKLRESEECFLKVLEKIEKTEEDKKMIKWATVLVLISKEKINIINTLMSKCENIK